MNSFYKRMLFVASVLLYTVSLLHAQDDFQKWLEKDQKQFNAFLSEEDKAFSDFLKQEWQPFNSLKGTKRDQAPKPVELPKAKEKPAEEPKVKPKPIRKLPDVPKEPIVLPKPKPKPVRHPIVKRFTFTFMNVPLELDYEKDFNLQLSGEKINNKTIGTAWQVMSSSPGYKKMVEQLIALRKDMALNDWGWMQLVQSFAKQVMPKSENKQILFIWFILNKSGYDVRTAYSQNTIYLLFPSTNNIYGNNYITIGDVKYYFLKTINTHFRLDKKVYTYKKTYKNDNKKISMQVRHTPRLSNEILRKELTFKFRGNSYSIPVQYEKDVVTFFRSYPQTQLQIYFDAPISPEANASLLNALRPYVENKSELEAINFLLRFVQTSFAYETDDRQFGREKYLMPEETLFYPNSDCEDRAILFAYLVKHLLGMPVVGLDYPGHIATAVSFTTPIPGKSVSFKDKGFSICDPTYVNADAGMCMPQYQNVAPKIINLF